MKGDRKKIRMLRFIVQLNRAIKHVESDPNAFGVRWVGANYRGPWPLAEGRRILERNRAMLRKLS